MAVNLSPVGGVAAQFFTNNAVPLSGGKLYTYAAGTTTPQVAYTTSQGNIAWTNPIVLDAGGRVPGSGEVWLTDGLIYKFVLKDANDVLIATYDNITGINSNFVAFTNSQEIQTATAGQTVFTLTTMQYQVATNSLSVFVDGVNQYGPGAQYAYVETDSTTVTFASGLHVGAEVKFTTTQQQGAGAVDASQVSYTPPFTGSVTTNVEAKLSEWVSPQDFGAAGNSNASGSTGTNDTGAFTLLEAEQSGGVVNLDNKFYLVSSPIPTKNNYINGKFVLANGTTYDQPNNFSLGHNALFSNTFVPLQWPAGGGIDYASGNYNTAVGDSALYTNTTGRRNTAVGTYAMYSNIGGYYNSAFGSLALYTNTSGNYNNAFGNQSLQFNTTGSNNCAFGMGAMTSNVDGNDNVAVGYLALQITASPDRVVAIGTQAAYRYEGADAVAIGFQALSNAGANGLYNVAIGSAAMGAMTTGGSNVAIGRRALAAQTTASNNVAIGTDAMVSSGNSDQNVAIGGSALANTTTGFQNVGIGYAAGNALTDGANNVFIGRFAAQLTTSGDGCVVVGEQAMASNVDGDRNTCVGQGADSGGTSYNNITSLGYQATVTGSNQVQLGNASTTTYVYGAVQNRSDARDKADVRNTVLGLNFINALRPVDFKWDMRDDYRTAPPAPPAPEATDEEKAAHKAAMVAWREANQLSKLTPDGSKKRNRYHHGLIAQEVKAAAEAAGVDFGGFQDHSIKGGDDVLSIGYEELVPVLIKAVQQLSAEVEALKAAR